MCGPLKTPLDPRPAPAQECSKTEGYIGHFLRTIQEFPGSTSTQTRPWTLHSVGAVPESSYGVRTRTNPYSFQGPVGRRSRSVWVGHVPCPSGSAFLSYHVLPGPLHRWLPPSQKVYDWSLRAESCSSTEICDESVSMFLYVRSSCQVAYTVNIHHYIA